MIGIAGAGAFGTALAVAVALARDGREVRLWAQDGGQVQAMQATRRNDVALPGVKLPESVSVHTDIGGICRGEALLLAVSMQALGGLLARWPQVGGGQALVACCKGVEVVGLW